MDIYKRRDMVMKIAMSRGYTKEQAEDIAQDDIVGLIENPRKKTQSCKQAMIDSLRAGIYSTRYKRSSEGKMVLSPKRLSIRDFNNLLEKLHTKTESLEDDYIRIEDVLLGVEALCSLDKKGIFILIANYFYDISTRDIARYLGVTQAAVSFMAKSRLYGANKAFKRKAKIGN